MLQPLLQQPVPDVGTLLRCVQAYAWAGYHSQHQFYEHFAKELTDIMVGLSPDKLVEACMLFGGAAHYQERFFHAAERMLVGQHIIEQKLKPREVALVAIAF